MPSEPCGAQHPDLLMTCGETSPNHAEHMAIPPGSMNWFSWPNANYVPVVPPTPKKKWEPKPPRKHTPGNYKDAVDAVEDAAKEKAREALTGEHAFENGVETSHTAAGLARLFSAESRVRVMTAIVDSEGITDEMLGQVLDMGLNTVRPRRGELATAGLIEVIGISSTASGHDAQLWAATALGLVAYNDHLASSSS